MPLHRKWKEMDALGFVILREISCISLIASSGRSPIPVHLRLVRWFCGWEEGEEAERHHQQLEQHLVSGLNDMLHWFFNFYKLRI